jgi:hypothetical protein
MSINELYWACEIYLSKYYFTIFFLQETKIYMQQIYVFEYYFNILVQGRFFFLLLLSLRFFGMIIIKSLRYKEKNNNN